MATLTTVGIKKDASLSELQSRVQDMEGVLGPLVAIGKGQVLATDGSVEQDVTTAAFDTDPASPDSAKRAILQPASASPLSGTTPICTGDCYVAGQLTRITAYRPQ